MNDLLININLNVLFWLFATLWFGCLLVVCISVSHLQYSLGLKTMQHKLNLNNFLYCQQSFIIFFEYVNFNSHTEWTAIICML
jgi:hypothetical protein